jgi:prepilin peptidase dependent protein B
MLKKQRGVTLVELMIAGTIGLIAVSAVIAIYQATATQTMRQLETAHLHSTAQGIMDLISADVRRAGYWHIRPGKDQLRNNPFQQPENRLQTGAKNGEQAESCLLFSYDLDKDSKVGVGKCPAKGCAPQTDADNVEQFGFRLKNKAIQMRYAGKTFNCQQGFWQAVTDRSTIVTQLLINLTSRCLNLTTSTIACDNNVDRLDARSVDIILSAHNTRRKDIKILLTRHIEIRNDRFVVTGDTL